MENRTNGVVKALAILLATVICICIFSGITFGIVLCVRLLGRISDSDDNYLITGNANSHFASDISCRSESWSNEGDTEKITSITINVGSEDMTFETAKQDYISIELVDVPETYYIKQEGDSLILGNSGSVSFSIWNHDSKIKVYIPENYQFDAVIFKQGSGTSDISGLNTYSLNVENGSGHMKLSNVTSNNSTLVNGSGELIVKNSALGVLRVKDGSGNVVLNEISGVNSNIESGSGNVTISGKMTGKNYFETGSGAWAVVIEGDKSDYVVKGDIGSGSIYMEKPFGKDFKIGSDKAPNSIEATVGSGNISIEFK